MSVKGAQWYIKMQPVEDVTVSHSVQYDIVTYCHLSLSGTVQPELKLISGNITSTKTEAAEIVPLRRIQAHGKTYFHSHEPFANLMPCRLTPRDGNHTRDYQKRTHNLSNGRFKRGLFLFEMKTSQTQKFPNL